ncbi:MAG: hypothetical protein IJ203_09290 [Atopobiaceae bacterium]|nr:hypothetical protein [Atopobiaceae bacterium]
MTEEERRQLNAHITTAVTDALLVECARRKVTAADVRDILGAAGRAMTWVSERYAPPDPDATFTMPDLSASNTVYIIAVPSLRISQTVMARFASAGKTREVEAKVVDVVVGRYLANCENEIAYLLRWDEGASERWCHPGEIFAIKSGNEWADCPVEVWA